ncbi:MAG TPA: DUF1992 domain-containing protein [Pseudonocardia sp.]|jgi:hypothetical protein|nr:DUF1992 domain-containing protein [Pseudonocardia sp.]
MNDRLSRFESVVDEQIRKAQERGDFDNLPGKGKPLAGLDEPDDELWWVRRYISREGLSSDALLPPSLQLRKEIARLDETVRDLASERDVHDAVVELNRRVAECMRVPVGPSVPLTLVNADDTVTRWRAARAAPATPESSAVEPPDGPADDVSTPPRPKPWWRRLGHRTAR